jgi:hypothetical protein
MPGTEQGDGLVVLLLDGGEQIVAKGFYFLADFSRLLNEQLKTHERQRLVQTADDCSHIQSCRRGFRQQSRINRRLKQRQLPEDALDIKTISNLEQSVRNGTRPARELAGARILMRLRVVLQSVKLHS